MGVETSLDDGAHRGPQSARQTRFEPTATTSATNVQKAIEEVQADVDAVTVTAQAANKIYAGPASGADAAPTFRTMVAADVPANLISNAKLAQMAQATFKMRAAGAGTGDPIDGTAAQAKTALAIAITDVASLQDALDAKQPLDSDLTAIAALTPTDGNFIVGDGAAWVVESGATARASLGAAPDDTAPATLLTTRGDLIRRGAAAPERVGKGFNGEQLAADANDALWGTLPGFLWGLTLASAADADHDITVAIGRAASDDTEPRMMRRTAAITKQFDATFAEGTNAGGAIAGVALPTSGTWHVWLMMKADGTVDVGGSTSLSPTLPTGFIYKRRIGSLRTNSSANFLAFSQDGDEFFLATVVADVGTSTLGTSAELLSLSVPNGIKVQALFHANGSNASTSNIYLSSPDQSDESASNPRITVRLNSTTNSLGLGRLRTNTSGQIRAIASAASTSLNIGTVGWIDTRGRLG